LFEFYLLNNYSRYTYLRESVQFSWKLHYYLAKYKEKPLVPLFRLFNEVIVHFRLALQFRFIRDFKNVPNNLTFLLRVRRTTLEENCCPFFSVMRPHPNELRCELKSETRWYEDAHLNSLSSTIFSLQACEDTYIRFRKSFQTRKSK